MTASRTETLSKIAAYIEDIVSVAELMPNAALAADLHRKANVLRELLVFVSDLPDAFDEDPSWWPEWSAAQALLRPRPRLRARWMV